MGSPIQQKIYSFQNLGLGTLGAATALIGSTKIDATRLQGAKIKDIFGAFHWDGKTSGDGPVYFGFCNGLSTSEIAAVFAADPQSQDDPSGDAANQRLIVIGQMGIIEQNDLIEDDHWHKLMWPTSWEIREGETFDIFAFNREGSALATGTTLRFNGMLNTEWRQD